MKIKEIKPLFDTVITTAKKYETDLTTDSGLVLASRMEGSLNEFQTVVAVGPQCAGVNVGDVVKINFMSYARPEHKSKGISGGVEGDEVIVRFDVPTENIDGHECLRLHYRDLMYVAIVEVDAGGLLQ